MEQRTGETNASSDEETQVVITDETIQRVADANRIQAEIGYLTERLRQIPDREVEHNSYVRSLVERRNALLASDSASTRDTRDSVARECEALIVGINDRLATPWRASLVQGFVDRSNQVPDDKYGTTGFIESFPTSAGKVNWAGSLRDLAGTDPLREKWWHRTWSGSTVFPAAPFKGWLHYRFDLRTEGHIYYAPVDSGAIQEYVCVGRSSNAAVPPSTWETVAWPLNLSLPYEPNLGLGNDYAFAIVSSVTGSIPVEQGASSSLCLILGTMLGFANGGTDIAGVWMAVTIPGHYFSGTIEYRFIPNWWIAGITEHFNA